MSTAVVAVSGVLSHLQMIWNGLLARTPTAHSRVNHAHQYATKYVAINTDFIRANEQIGSNIKPQRPLRVVRMLEAGQAPAAVGRMTISGRMADVCAELDRLAACESLPS